MFAVRTGVHMPAMILIMADLSPTAAANRLGLSTSAIYKAVRSQELPARMPHARKMLISERDLTAWSAAREAQVSNDPEELNGLHHRCGHPAVEQGA